MEESIENTVPNLLQSCSLDCFSNFVDPVRYNCFDDFYRKRKFIKALFYINIYYTFFVFPSNVFAIFYVNNPGAWLYSALFLFLNICLCLSGWAIAVVGQFDKWLNIIRRVYIVSISLVLLFSSLRNALTTCDFLPRESRFFILGWHCDRESAIPAYTLPLLTLIPIGAIVGLCETRLEFVLLIMLLNCVAYILIAVTLEDKSYIFDTLSCTALSALICIDQHQFHIEIYLAYDKLAATLKENKRMLEENQAAEFRGMIGNLTHDLKTPLQSFMAGIEIMAHNISAIAQLTQESQSSLLSYMQPHFDSFVQCFKNIRNTNTFMLMTINRCLDYTKASKGLRLMPKYDTVDLLDTLSMPMQCMMNIQDRIPIEMEPLAVNICTHIITDKQWLQENILCLLSNAVKYSSEGTVTLSVSLKVSDSIPATKELKSPHLVRNILTLNLKQSKYLVKNEIELIPLNTHNLNTSLDHYVQLSSTSRSPRSSRSARSPRVLPIPSNESLPNPLSFDEIENVNVKRTLFSLDDDELIQDTNESERIPQQAISINTPFLRFEISDHGVGLSEDEMKALYHPFQQAQRLAGGTGLGLYSLAKRMDAIHGKYGVENRRDDQKGSIFWFEIPYRADEVYAETMKLSIGRREDVIEEVTEMEEKEDHAQVQYQLVEGEMTLQTHEDISHSHFRPSALQIDALEDLVQNLHVSIKTPHSTPKHHHSSFKDDSVLASSPCKSLNRLTPHTTPSHIILSSRQTSPVNSPSFQHGTGWNILIADDSPTVVKMISMMLLQQQHQVTVAENGEAAIQKMKKQWEEYGIGFDMVLMDLQMPVLDGLEATRRYRRWEKESGRHQIIVGMSANSDEETIDQAFAAGVNDFIRKPFQMETFKIVVRKLLKKS